MALTRTQRSATTSSGVAQTAAFESATFTPANDSLLVAIGLAVEESDSGMEGTDLTVSDSLGTLTWTSRAATVTSPLWSYGIRIWTAPVTTGASMTVSVDCGARSIQYYRLEVFDYTSNAGSVGTGASAIGSSAVGNGADSITLSAAPALASEVIAAVMTLNSAGTGSIDPAAGWTELNDVTAPNWSTFQTQARTGSTSTTVGWDDLLNGGTPFGGSVMAALEITEVGGGGGRRAMTLLGVG